jgi:hypothetical protein
MTGKCAGLREVYPKAANVPAVAGRFLLAYPVRHRFCELQGLSELSLRFN